MLFEDPSGMIRLRNWAEERIQLNPSTEPDLFFDIAKVQAFYNILINTQGWPARQSQREMIGHVAARFLHGGIAMIEAPTGTGKTLAYALPAAIWSHTTGQQVVISSSTK